ncbi:MAG: DUF2332 domain-containing protein [Myxococcota bacterium]|nr:DUF2332 domain-containing protein [Myxococcota bacterium]
MSARSGVDELGDDLRDVRSLVADRNVVYARALPLIEALLTGPDADPDIVARLVHAWRERTFRSFYERPLLLLASLREAASNSPTHPLGTSFAGTHPEPAAVTREALVAAFAPDQTSTWSNIGLRKIQTNDVSRALAWRWPVRAIGDRPIVLVDVGCAAGLNLVADALEPPWKDQDGRALPIPRRPKIAERIGFDADPIDARHVDESSWLRACLWPGDHARLDRLDEAVDAMVSAWLRPDAPRLIRALAHEVPARLDAITRRAPEGACVLVFQSFLREYLDDEEARTYSDGLRHWIAAAPPGRAMWTELELAARQGTHPAELVAHVRADEGPLELRIARCSYHPIDVDVDREAFATLESALRPYAPVA